MIGDRLAEHAGVGVGGAEDVLLVQDADHPRAVDHRQLADLVGAHPVIGGVHGVAGADEDHPAGVGAVHHQVA